MCHCESCEPPDPKKAKPCVCQDLQMESCPAHGRSAIPAAVHTFEARIRHLEAACARERYLAHLAAEISLLEAEGDSKEDVAGEGAQVWTLEGTVQGRAEPVEGPMLACGERVVVARPEDTADKLREAVVDSLLEAFPHDEAAALFVEDNWSRILARVEFGGSG